MSMWYLIAFMAGALFGFFIMALMNAARED